MVVYAYKANIKEAEGRGSLQIQGQLFNITNSGLIWDICKDIVSKLCIKYKYIQNIVLPYDYVYLLIIVYITFLFSCVPSKCWIPRYKPVKLVLVKQSIIKLF